MRADRDLSKKLEKETSKILMVANLAKLTMNRWDHYQRFCAGTIFTILVWIWELKGLLCHPIRAVRAECRYQVFYKVHEEGSKEFSLLASLLLLKQVCSILHMQEIYLKGDLSRIFLLSKLKKVLCLHFFLPGIKTSELQTRIQAPNNPCSFFLTHHQSKIWEVTTWVMWLTYQKRQLMTIQF